MTGRASRKATATSGKCPTCSAPTITGWDDDNAALHVTADLTPLTPTQEAQIRTDPNRLTWCLRTNRWTPPRIAWISPSTHPTPCPHPHVTDHRCQPQPTSTLF